MNSRYALKWAFAVVGLGRLQTHLAALKEMASGQDVEGIESLQRAADRIDEFVQAHSSEQSRADMSSETCERLVAAVDEIGDQAFKCFRALVLTSEPLIDVLAEWYAADNFGKSAYSRLVPLMA